MVFYAATVYFSGVLWPKLQEYAGAVCSSAGSLTLEKQGRTGMIRRIMTYPKIRYAFAEIVRENYLSPYLPRPLTMGILQAAHGRAVITPGHRFSYAPGFPLKSVGGREKVSLAPAQVVATGMPLPASRLPLIAGQPGLSPPKAIVMAAGLALLAVQVLYLQYGIFHFQCA